jgi:hypothetical protein
MRFYGKLLQAGQAVADDVSGDMDLLRTGGTKRWQGYLTAPADSNLDGGEEYTLVLDDGRTLEIILERFTITGDPGRGPFYSNGPLH